MTPLVAGNWKMHGTLGSIEVLLEDLSNELDAVNIDCELLVLPAFVHIGAVTSSLRDSDIKVGAQDVDHRLEGAVTGGVSAGMLSDLGCEFVLVGHSERRTLFGNTDQLVADKFVQSQAHGLTPILCVGETLEERKAGATLSVVTRQLQAVLTRVGIVGMSKALLAYEPVWAIGTGESATPEQAEEVHLNLRASLQELDAEVAESTAILYGGSVSPDNAGSLFEMKNIDGALVGGASLKAKSFVEICKAATNR